MPVKIEGKVDFSRIIDNFTTEKRQIITDTLTEVIQNVVSEMESPKHGIKYGNHTASAPNEAPAIQTTELLTTVEIDDENGSITFVAEHAAIMEFGSVFIAPRPFLIPAVNKVIPYFEKRLNELIK